MGFANSIFQNSIWPAVPLVVPLNYCGLAFGIMNSVSTVAMTIAPLVVPALYNSSDERYIPNVLLFFGIISLISTVVGIYWNYEDYNTGSLCNSPDKGVGNPPFVGDPVRLTICSSIGSVILCPQKVVNEINGLDRTSSILHSKDICERESELVPLG
jgi:MFS family permease